MAKTIKINEKDFSDYFTPSGSIVGYEVRSGNNAGMTIAGDTIADELSYKAVVKLVCMPLTEAQMSELYQELYSTQYPVLYYYDTMRGQYRSIATTRSVTEATFRGTSITGNNYWTGTEITFTER